MQQIKVPAFGEISYVENRESRNAHVYVVSHATEDLFASYCALFEREGYIKKETYHTTARHFAAFEGKECGAFLNYYPHTEELCIIEEEDCLYFDFADESKGTLVAPQITQIALEDFGMSYVIRLSDGRFIVIDGGFDFVPDREKLFRCLKEGNPEEKPVIAAWILSHPHHDHFHCFIGFVDQYADEVVIEKLLFNFPEIDDAEHYPQMVASESPLSAVIHVPRMMERIAKTGAQIYTPHTGQRYVIGDAALEILACVDDTIHVTQNGNATSLVIRMELGGQVILWTCDAGFSYARIPERYGDYLKADILQVPHHGFQCGTASAEIAGYELIRPSVCLLPASDHVAYTLLSVYREGTRHLMRAPYVEEMITGTVQRTLTLPYTAREGAQKEGEHKLLRGLENNGARTWVYTGLSTAREEDFIFTLLNMSILPATVDIELYFEDKARTVTSIRAEVGRTSLREICITGEDVDGDALYYNPNSLKCKGVPENRPFAVRFISDKPIVVSHKHHAASYHSTI